MQSQQNALLSQMKSQQDSFFNQMNEKERRNSELLKKLEEKEKLNEDLLKKLNESEKKFKSNSKEIVDLINSIINSRTQNPDVLKLLSKLLERQLEIVKENDNYF